MKKHNEKYNFEAWFTEEDGKYAICEFETGLFPEEFEDVHWEPEWTQALQVSDDKLVITYNNKNEFELVKGQSYSESYYETVKAMTMDTVRKLRALKEGAMTVYVVADWSECCDLCCFGYDRPQKAFRNRQDAERFIKNQGGEIVPLVLDIDKYK